MTPEENAFIIQNLDKLISNTCLKSGKLLTTLQQSVLIEEEVDVIESYTNKYKACRELYKCMQIKENGLMFMFLIKALDLTKQTQASAILKTFPNQKADLSKVEASTSKKVAENNFLIVKDVPTKPSSSNSKSLSRVPQITESLEKQFEILFHHDIPSTIVPEEIQTPRHTALLINGFNETERWALCAPNVKRQPVTSVATIPMTFLDLYNTPSSTVQIKKSAKEAKETGMYGDGESKSDLPTKYKGACKSQPDPSPVLWEIAEILGKVLLVTYLESAWLLDYKVIKINDCTKLEKVSSWKCPSRVCCFQYDKTNLISGHSDGKIRIWDMATMRCTHTLDVHSDYSVWSIQFNDNIIVGGGEGKILIWDMNSLKILAKFEDKSIKFYRFKLVKCNLVAVEWHGKLYSFDIGASGDINVNTKTQAHNPYSDALDSDDEFVITGGYDKTVKVWRFGTLELVKTLVGHESEVKCVSYCNRIVVSGEYYRAIRLWDVDNGECVRVLNVGDNCLCRLALDAIRLVTGHDNGTVKIWGIKDILNVDSTVPCSFKTVRINDTRITAISLNECSMVASSGKTMQCFKFVYD